MKLTKRKGFNFFRSYFDVYNELNDKDKVAFIDALLDRQFLGLEPKNLTGMAKFAYISQTNSIDSQVKGYNDKARALGNPLLGENTHPTDGGTAPPCHGGQQPPTVQVEEKGKEKEKVKGKNIPPLSEFLEYGFEKEKNLDKKALELKYDAWVTNGWKDGNQKKIVNWKSKLLNTIPHLPKKTSLSDSLAKHRKIQL